LYATRTGSAFLDCHASAKSVEIFFAWLPTDLDEVSLLDPRGGARELVGEFAIISHQQEAFAEIVEATDGVEAFARLGEKLHDGGPTFGIADRGDVALGFVEDEVAMALGTLEELAIDTNMIAGGVGFAAELSNDLSIDLNTTGGDEFFRMAATGDAGLRKDLLQAFEDSGSFGWNFLVFFGDFGNLESGGGKIISSLLEGVAFGGCGLGFFIGRRVYLETSIKRIVEFGPVGFRLMRMLFIVICHGKVSVLPAFSI